MAFGLAKKSEKETKPRLKLNEIKIMSTIFNFRPFKFENILKLFLAFVLAIFARVEVAEAIVKGSENSTLSKYSIMVLDDHGRMCSAAILTKKVILTAAHCVSDATDWRVYWRSENEGPNFIKPNKILVHPLYRPYSVGVRQRSVDLALISLSDPLPDQFEPLLLTEASVLSVGDVVTVAGFGFSEDKNSKTLGKMRSVDLSVVQPYGPSHSIIWLADPASSGAGACQGDSGGLILYQGKLFAIVSWTTGEGRSSCGTYTQGIMLLPEMKWINSFINGLLNQSSK